MSVVQVRDAPSSTDPLRYRITPWQMILPCGIYAGVLIGQFVAFFLQAQPGLTDAERHQLATSNAYIFAFFVALFPLVVWQSRRWGVILTPTEARVYGLGTRVIRWSDVRAVEVEDRFGSRIVVLHEVNRRTRLRAPSTGFLAWDKRFDEKFRTIEQWWLTHRGPTDSAF
jgi:hypothetical protein